MGSLVFVVAERSRTKLDQDQLQHKQLVVVAVAAIAEAAVVVEPSVQVFEACVVYKESIIEMMLLFTYFKICLPGLSWSAGTTWRKRLSLRIQC